MQPKMSCLKGVGHVIFNLHLGVGHSVLCQMEGVGHVFSNHHICSGSPPHPPVLFSSPLHVTFTFIMKKFVLYFIQYVEPF